MQPDPCPPAQEVRFLDASLIRAAPAQVVGYNTVIATTALGLPILPRWCVWVQPSAGVDPDRWERRWLTAVSSALTTWRRELSVIQVDSPEKANVLIERRRPPRRRLPGGWRASNGFWPIGHQRLPADPDEFRRHGAASNVFPHRLFGVSRRNSHAKT